MFPKEAKKDQFLKENMSNHQKGKKEKIKDENKRKNKGQKENNKLKCKYILRIPLICK